MRPRLCPPPLTALIVTGLLASHAAAQDTPHHVEAPRPPSSLNSDLSPERWRSLPHTAGPLLRAAWTTGWSQPQRALMTTTRGDVWLIKGDPDTLMAVAAGGDLHSLGVDADLLSPPTLTLTEPADAHVAHLELAWPMRAQLDFALPAMGLEPDAQARRDLLGVSGQGVIIGVIDTGIDWTHPDFAGPDGLRILWLLDFTRPERVGRHPGVESYGGALWDQAELSEALLEREPDVDSQDLLGHGTHVAGIAAGRDRAGLGAAGMAPDAELIVVKATTSESSLSLDDAAVLAGVRFILDRAQALGRPAVINLSLGGHAGPHDGSSTFERTLSELGAEREGCVVVAAAGNDGTRAVHAQATRRPDAEIALRVSTYQRGWGEASFALMDVWYETTPDAEIAVELIAPDGRRTGLALPGETARELSAMSGPMTVSHTRTSPSQPTLRRVVALIQEPISGELAPGDYRLTFTGGPPGQRVDAWLAAPGLFNARLAGEVTQDGTLTVPGTARGVITVGASVTRDQWQARSGPQSDLRLKPGSPAAFSSLGPTRDGRPKPDLSAPGALVASAMARQADPELNQDSIFGRAGQAGFDVVLPEGRHAVFQGTSMATPFVSGAAALLLEQDPTRGAAQITDLLRASAAPLPLGTPWGWDRRAGFGLLDPAAALALARGEYGLAVSASESSVGVVMDVVDPDGGVTEAIVIARDAEGTPLAPGWRPTTRVTVEEGRALVGDPQPYGEHAVKIPISAGSARGVGHVEVSVEGVRLEARPQIAFVDQRASLAAPTSGQIAGGASCVLASSARGGGAIRSTWPLWMMCLVLGRRRPRTKS